MSATYTQDEMNVREVMNTITCGGGLGTTNVVAASSDNEWDGGNAATLYSVVDIEIECGGAV
ncbi:MAG: hypothetical protein DRJ15_11450 [Bacteroidetes bacterium]|nr:MAG: hypothetical protein DRJ15_11450 [Bacteroidota bacterium]